MKKGFSVVGMIASLVLVLMGILAINGVLGGGTSYPGSAPYDYDSGYAKFGNDYYTYTNNNMAESADGARMAAYNLDDISDFLKNAIGYGMIFGGIMAFCAFGIALGSCLEAEPVSTTPYTPMYPGAIPENKEAPACPPEPASETDFGGTVFVPENEVVFPVNAEQVVNDVGAEDFGGTQTMTESEEDETKPVE